jgi:hypothetical protein
VQETNYFFLPGACDSTDPARLLAILDDFGFWSTFEAFEASFGDDCFLFIGFLIKISITKYRHLFC